MSFKNTPIEDLKCIVLSSAPLEARKLSFIEVYEKVNKSEFYEQAKVDEVDSHTSWLMKELGIDLTPEWEESFNNVDTRINNLMDELERVAVHLDKFNIKIVGLKNAGITKGIYRITACSPMGDIDLLVSSLDFHRAHKLLVNDLGYTFEFRSELEDEDLEEAFRGGGTEYYKDVNGYKVWLELQWRPVAGRWIQPHNEPNGNDLIERSVEIEGSKVRLLAPEDNLLQVCLHTAKHSYCRAPGFRLHSDVDRIVRYTDLDWETFLRKTKELKLCTAVYFSLFFSKTLLETPIPEKVIEELKPSFITRKTILGFIKKAGIFNQEKKKFSKLGYIIFGMFLYDTISELLKSIFPKPKDLKEKYNFKSDILVPIYLVKRIYDLVIKRAKL